MAKEVTLTFVIDESQHKQLKEIASEEQRTLAGQLRFSLDEWLELYNMRNRRKSDK